MAKAVKKMLFIGAGTFLLFLGLLGLALPIMPGFILLFIGVAFLNKEFSWFGKLDLRVNGLLDTLKRFLHSI